jgi:hypothetical protein
MANEFVARNGIISQNNLIVSGTFSAGNSVVANMCVSNLSSGSAVFVTTDGLLTNGSIPAGVMISGTGTCSIVGKGCCNTASGYYAGALSGRQNTACGFISSTLSGAYNTASSNYSTVAGGIGNTACGVESFVGGGRCVVASGCESVVVAI